MTPELIKACEIIDKMRMRVMIPMDKQITAKQIDDFFKEVGYVPEIVRNAFRRRNPAMENGQKTPISDVQEM